MLVLALVVCGGEKLLLHGITSSLRDDDVDAYGFLSLSFRHHRVSSLHRAQVVAASTMARRLPIGAHHMEVLACLKVI
jgi:hypothetical protein